MADTQEVQQLPADAMPETRVKLKSDGKEYVYDGASWVPAGEWDVLAADEKISRVAAAYQQKNTDQKNARNKELGLPPEGQGLYDPYDEDQVKGLLLSMKDTERDSILKKIYESGGYGSSSRGNGLGNSDIAAFSGLLWLANYKNTNFREAIKIYEKEFPKNPSLISGTGGRKQPRQISNPDEIKAVFRKTAQNMLGRSLPDNVADQFVQMIQSQEATFQQQLATQSGGTLTQPADANLQAQQLIESQFEDQLRVQNAATFAGTMDQMIKGLAQ